MLRAELVKDGVNAGRARPNRLCALWDGSAGSWPPAGVDNDLDGSIVNTRRRMLRAFLPLTVAVLLQGSLTALLGWGAAEHLEISGIVIALLCLAAAVPALTILANRVARQIDRRDSERQTVEAALREHEERLSRIVETIADGVLILDLRGRITFANLAAQHIVGGGADLLIGRTYNDPTFAITTIYGDPFPEDEQPFVRVMRTGEPVFDVEQVVGHDPATQHVLSINSAPLRDGSGNLLGTVTTFRDITQQRSAEDALRESELRYRRLVESSPDATFVEACGRIVYANPAAVRLLGAVSAEQLYSSSLLDAIPAPRCAVVRSRMTSPDFETVPAESIVEPIVRLDGRMIEAELIAIPIAFRGEPATLTLVRDITERRQMERELELLATRDPLTDLFNRRRFQEELETRLSLSRRYNTGGAVVFLDLDRFKHVNDTLGHAAGDALLAQVAHCLRHRLRESDAIGRWGGDEFAMLLPHIGAREAGPIASDLLNRVRRTCAVADGAVDVAVSIGIALFPDHGDTADELLRCADLAMYQAKSGGRNGFRIFSPTVDTREPAASP